MVSIDISETLISQKKSVRELTYLLMDCTKMEFKDGLFDIVIDKSTLDSVLCKGLNEGEIYIK